MKRVLIGMGVLAGAYLALGVLVAAIQDRLIYHPSRTIVEPTDPAVRVVAIDTADGQTLRAWWRAPDPGRPVFLYFGGNADRPELQVGRWRRIADWGAGFLMPAYRGYSGSTGSPSEAGLHADANASYDWLLAQGVAPTDVVIHGFSLGSGPATRLAMERQARALVLEAPFMALDDLIVELAPAVIPWRYLLRSRFHSREWIGEVDEPILIVHGDADTVIPFAHGERLAALTAAPTTLVAMAGSDHATLARDGLYEHVWAFLDGLDGR